MGRGRAAPPSPGTGWNLLASGWGRDEGWRRRRPAPPVEALTAISLGLKPHPLLGLRPGWDIQGGGRQVAQACLGSGTGVGNAQSLSVQQVVGPSPKRSGGFSQVSLWPCGWTPARTVRLHRSSGFRLGLGSACGAGKVCSQNSLTAHPESDSGCNLSLIQGPASTLLEGEAGKGESRWKCIS